MLKSTRWMLLLALGWLSGPAYGRVVINEILYNAPDGLEDLEYVELYNTGDEAVDLVGWRFTKGVEFRFSEGTQLPGRGFLVLCRNDDRFKRFYDVPVAGVFQKALSNKGERLELSDASGRPVDVVRYKDDPPWPQGADGASGSLERICPDADGEDPGNWISSPLSEDRDRPAGTPGKPNAGFSAVLPPVIAGVTFTPALPATNQPVLVAAVLRDGAEAKEVRLIHRVVSSGGEAPEVVTPMSRNEKGQFAASIPGQQPGRLVRFRVEAVGNSGAVRRYPAATEPRPALSCYVSGPIDAAKIPVARILLAASDGGPALRRRAGGPGGGPDPEEMARFQARFLVDRGLDLQGAWFELTVRTPADAAVMRSMSPVFQAHAAERDKVLDDLEEAPDILEKVKTLPEVVEKLRNGLVEGLKPHLTTAQSQVLEKWVEAQRQPMERRFGPGMMVTMLVNLESAWYAVSVDAEPDEARLKQVRTVLGELEGERRKLVEEMAGGPQQETGFRDVREKAEALGEKLAERVTPLLSPKQQTAFDQARNPMGPFAAGPRGGPGRRGRSGRSGGAPSSAAATAPAFIYHDAGTRKTELFDFVEVVPRKGGYKVRFHKDQPLNGMTRINLIFESDMSVLAEPLAYELYRRAGMAAPQGYHLRLQLNDEHAGYQLLVEQPNRGFLRRNKIQDDGNLYKLLWYEQGVAGQHEKKTRVHEGKEDVVALVRELQQTSGEAQWQVIRKHFDVAQVVNYFAVNMVLSHWDGFFNNYFTYHDDKGTGKWTMYPWDQDQTWGIVGMGMWGPVFFDMPITFGMTGDVPPGQKRGAAPGRGFGFGGGPMWWRGPGWFSGPLLANTQFRQVFLARTKEILETIYTEAAFGPEIDAMGERLNPEIRLQAGISKDDPADALAALDRHLAALKEHLRKRREFLLAQPEVKNAGKFSREGL